VNTKKCDYCGKEFIPPTPKKRYCCEECKKKGNRKYNTEYAQITRAINKPKRYCKVCGKVLPKRAKSYCSVVCRDKARYERYKKKPKDNFTPSEQPCWTCKNACGGCSWSRSFEPVKGWKAKPSKIYYLEGDYTDSYKITYCPEYERRREEVKC
jgi:predicted nucleic acid-binding Zn ribbon protein